MTGAVAIGAAASTEVDLTEVVSAGAAVVVAALDVAALDVAAGTSVISAVDAVSGGGPLMIRPARSRSRASTPDAIRSRFLLTVSRGRPCRSPWRMVS